MNGLNSTYCQAILNATFSSTFVGSTFTGKEKDFESGYHYFGARYYDSEALTGWLSVVPMADKYLGFSSYQYCRWNPVKRIVVDGLFDTEKEAQKAHKKAAKRFGSERVGEIFNRGTEKKPDYSFLVYGVGKDNKTHGQRDGVWAYRPDETISNKRSLWLYSLKQRTIGISVSFSIGGQVSAGITMGKHVGFNANLSSVDLFSHKTEYSRIRQWDHYTYLIDDYNIHGNRGLGVSVYGIDLGYNCSYDAVGERIDKESMSHSGNIGPIQFGTNGEVSVGVDVAIIFGINVQIISRYAK